MRVEGVQIMLYLSGTIVRDDGNRMTEKRANAVFDAFLEWLEKQGCLFGGSFNPAYKDGDHVVTSGTTSGGPFIELVKSVEWTTPKRKTPKRKKR